MQFKLMEKNSKIFKTQDEEFVQSQIDKLRPINYNKFKWWRRWESKKRELQKNAPLAAKIRNGDLDFPHYYWQAQFCAIEINHKADQYKDTMSFLEATKMDRARRTHLLDEFEKKETERLRYLEVEFPKEFYMTKTDYHNELETFDGTLMEFYRYCEKKFTKKLRNKERRGRPPKHKEQLDNLVKTIRDL